MKQILNKFNFVKVKNFYSVKDTVKRMEKNKSEAGKNLCQTHI